MAARDDLRAVILPGIGWLVSKINRRLRRLNREHQTLTNELSYIVEETVGGYKVVKLHGGEAYESLRFNAMTDRLRGYAMRVAVAGGLNQPVTQFLAALALSIILAIAMLQAQANQTTVGGFTGFVMAMLLLISPLKHLTDVNQPLQRGLTAAEFIFGLIDTPIEPQEGGKHIDRARGDIRFDNVTFRYGEEGPGARSALDSVNLHVKPGEVVALVGPSGSGKTTLVNLLPRFVAASSGQVLIDGVAAQDWRLESLRAQFAMVSQDVVMFNDSIAANVALGAAIDEERVQHCLAAANLAEHVASLPQGIHTLVGHNATQLSGGQRQRLAIARALYKDAPILILDEATSALDTESERLVQDALQRLMQGRTTLVIAHRLSTIEHADRVIVMQQGRVAEQGTHAQLLAQGGIYARLQNHAG